jgi:hypothetical protein
MVRVLGERLVTDEALTPLAPTDILSTSTQNT